MDPQKAGHWAEQLGARLEVKSRRTTYLHLVEQQLQDPQVAARTVAAAVAALDLCRDRPTGEAGEDDAPKLRDFGSCRVHGYPFNALEPARRGQANSSRRRPAPRRLWSRSRCRAATSTRRGSDARRQRWLPTPSARLCRSLECAGVRREGRGARPRRPRRRRGVLGEGCGQRVLRGVPGPLQNPRCRSQRSDIFIARRLGIRVSTVYGTPCR
jgi:hypothetical protein